MLGVEPAKALIHHRINISYFHHRQHNFSNASQRWLTGSPVWRFVLQWAGRNPRSIIGNIPRQEVSLHIDTHRLHLRPVMASDVDDLYRIYGDPATNTFNPAGPYPNIDYAEVVLRRWLAHWQTHGFGNWAISMRNTPEHIIGFGGVSLRSYNDVTINNLGYRFSTEAWGKGLATEFAIDAMRYGFEVLKLAEMSAVVRANHLASQKVLEKAGMRYINDIADVKDAPPSLLYSLTLNEWLSQISGCT